MRRARTCRQAAGIAVRASIVRAPLRRAALVAAAVAATPATAQIYTDTIDTVVPIQFDRGRNESVLQRPHPETAPIGLPAGGFTLFPTLDVQAGYSNNVYQTDTNRQDDGFLRLAPRLLARSNWSRHSVQIDGGGDLIRYADQTPRNQNGWQLGARGRYDANDDLVLNVGAETQRAYESQFSGAAVTNVRNLTPYQRSQVRALVDARFGRLRVAPTINYVNYDFKDVTVLGGGTLSQDNRDRRLVRGALQLEYGVTPDAGVFGLASYTNTDYDTVLAPGIANRDSREWRLLGGVTLDLSALIRGSFGIGYIDRRFSSPLYRSISGFSFDGRLEYFASAITTVTLVASREIQDSTLAGSGFFTTGAILRVDHELLRNLQLNAGIAYNRDRYIGVPGTARVLRASGGATYLANRLLTGKLDLTYARRRSDFTGVNGPQLSEARVLAGVVIHP